MCGDLLPREGKRLTSATVKVKNPADVSGMGRCWGRSSDSYRDRPVPGRGEYKAGSVRVGGPGVGAGTEKRPSRALPDIHGYRIRSWRRQHGKM